MFLGLGFRTGVWHLQFFAAMPVIVFSAALLYALVAWIGALTRSTALAVIVGYVYYVVLEWFVWGLQVLDQVLARGGVEYRWVTALSEGSRWAFPGFGRLRIAAQAAVLDSPSSTRSRSSGDRLAPALLTTGYLWFRRLDF
jgi:hypothetical protein